jgi:hypothetical protein
MPTVGSTHTDTGISGGAVCRPLHAVVRRNHSLENNL